MLAIPAAAPCTMSNCCSVQNIGTLSRTRVLTTGVFEGGGGSPGAVILAAVEQSACGTGQHQSHSSVDWQ